MQLQTQIPLSKSNYLINYESRLLLLGSCFSEHIGQKFDYFKFQALSNPFGILFHPKAIENLIDRAVHKKTYTKEEVFTLNERWHSFDAHSEKSALNQDKLIEELNIGLGRTKEQLQQTSQLIITLGTAWVYRYLATDRVVANCHKVPQKEFSKKLLSVAEVVQSLAHILDLVQSVNESVHVIFTISPVRHLKDGFVENQRSKAHLITAVHQVVNSPSRKGGRECYFPSYEIMMDELRDYRFYKRDMVHPDQTAIDYIWERFQETYIDPKAHTVMTKVAEVQKGLTHRPFNPNSDQHKKFLKSLEAKITYLKKQHPHIGFGRPE